MADLAESLASLQEDDVKVDTLERLGTWLAFDRADPEGAQRLNQIAADGALDIDGRLSLAIAYLNPARPLSWRGTTVSALDFVAHSTPRDFERTDLATLFFGKGAWRWLVGHSSVTWLQRIDQSCRERAAILGLADLNEASARQWWWLLASPSALQESAANVRNCFVASNNSKLNQLLRKAELQDLEALELAVAPAAELLTVATAWEELVKMTLLALTELERQVHRRPISRQELEAIESILEETLRRLHNEREALRPRRAQLDEPASLHQSIATIRTALRERLRSHKALSNAFDELREIIATGHLKHAIEEGAKLKNRAAEFSDLSLDFFKEAESQHDRQVRRLIILVATIATAMILFAIVLKEL